MVKWDRHVGGYTNEMWWKLLYSKWKITMINNKKILSLLFL